MIDPVDTTIISMWADGATAGQIAQMTCLSRGMVMGKVNQFYKTGDISFTVRSSRIAAIRERVEGMEEKRLADFGNYVAKNFQDMPRIPPINFNQLKPKSCRFIVSGSGIDDFLYCGQDKVKSSYCKHHYKLCYVPHPKKGTQNNATT